MSRTFHKHSWFIVQSVAFLKHGQTNPCFPPAFRVYSPLRASPNSFPGPNHQHPTVHITAQLVCPMDRPFGKHTPMPWSQPVYPNLLPPACLQRTQEVFLSVTDCYKTHTRLNTHLTYLTARPPNKKKNPISLWATRVEMIFRDSKYVIRLSVKKDKHRSPFINLMKTKYTDELLSQLPIFFKKTKNGPQTKIIMQREFLLV